YRTPRSLYALHNYTLPFLFSATPTTHIYTLSLHDALPISAVADLAGLAQPEQTDGRRAAVSRPSFFLSIIPYFLPCVNAFPMGRSEEHTSELQSRFDLVCRLLLENKKKTNFKHYPYANI